MSLVRVAAVGWLLAASASAAAEPSSLEKLLARTQAIAKEVAKLRGLPLKKAIPNEVVDRDELRRRLLAMSAETKAKAETAADGFTLARWGMIPFGLDYEALLIEIFTEQIAGYYDPATNKLAISTSAADDPEQAELVLAHEIDHALQDQAFDLEKFENVPRAESDAAMARRALVEGDGVALMIEVMLARRGQAAPWSDPRVASALDASMSVPGTGDALDRAPLVVRETLLFPYRAGTTFVAALRRRQPWTAVDAAFKQPPLSTEHILHPERYLLREPPVPVALRMPAALRGFSTAHEGVWGELGFSLFLRAHGLDARVAATAAEGWGGDRVLTFAADADRRPHRGVGIARFVWDTEADALEAAEAVGQVLDRATAGATLDRARDRMRWMSVDGRVSWVERRGTSIVIVVGAPAWTAAALVEEAWTASSVAP